MRFLPRERTAHPVTWEAVAAELRAAGEELAFLGAAQDGDAFTPLSEADALIKSSPEAFLLGVLFTQGVPAERAWAGPYLLRERLGHLDLARLATETEAVARAFAQPPALHRFVKTLPRWVSAAAARLIEQYGGSASTIWPDGERASEVTRRLLEFSGVGEKKAVMAVEILTRHFGVALEGLDCGSVAYDIHVRRVFLRSGLVDADTPEAVREAARAACPETPGLLDLPAWQIGRTWCRPREPRCGECRLAAVCPRLVEHSPTGVGARRR